MARRPAKPKASAGAKRAKAPQAAPNHIDEALSRLEGVLSGAPEDPAGAPEDPAEAALASYQPNRRPLVAALAAEAATNAIAAMLSSDGIALDPTVPARDLVRDEILRWIHQSTTL